MIAYVLTKARYNIRNGFLIPIRESENVKRLPNTATICKPHGSKHNRAKCMYRHRLMDCQMPPRVLCMPDLDLPKNSGAALQLHHGKVWEWCDMGGGRG